MQLYHMHMHINDMPVRVCMLLMHKHRVYREIATEIGFMNVFSIIWGTGGTHNW